MVLLRGAYRLYCARCRLVGQWWRSERAAPHRAAVAAVREAARARRAMRKELRLVAVYVLRQRKKADKRRARGLPQGDGLPGAAGPWRRRRSPRVSRPPERLAPMVDSQETIGAAYGAKRARPGACVKLPFW